MAKKLLTYHFSEPLDGIKTAKVDIDAGDGNLAIGRLSGGEAALASGALQYLENQNPPVHMLETSAGQMAFTLRAGGRGQTWLRLPWSACNGATEWQVQLNPVVTVDVRAHTSGGNVKIDLDGMAVTGLAADTGGGNIEVVLPGGASYQAAVKTGAGNVDVSVPAGAAVRIQARSGLGKVFVDERFGMLDKDTYQSDGYDGAAEKIEISASSGAGNVTISTR